MSFSPGYKPPGSPMPAKAPPPMNASVATAAAAAVGLISTGCIAVRDKLLAVADYEAQRHEEERLRQQRKLQFADGAAQQRDAASSKGLQLSQLSNTIGVLRDTAGERKPWASLA